MLATEFHVQDGVVVKRKTGGWRDRGPVDPDGVP